MKYWLAVMLALIGLSLVMIWNTTGRLTAGPAHHSKIVSGTNHDQS